MRSPIDSHYLLASALSVLGFGCANGSPCTSLGACGGDPSGTWQNGAAAVCQDGPYSTPLTVQQPGAAFDDRQGRPALVAGQPPSQPTLAEWCEDLVLQDDPMSLLLSTPGFVFQDAAISGFSLKLDGSTLAYQLGFARVGRFSQYYSENCLERFGQDPNDCTGIQTSLLAADPNNQASCNPAGGGGCSCTYLTAGGPTAQSGQALTCALAALVLNNDPRGAPALKNESDKSQIYSNVACVPSPSRGGCDCGFDVSFRTDESGSYKVEGNLMTTYPLKAVGVPGLGSGGVDYGAQATFCQHGDSLELSGAGSSYLFNRAPLRTVALTRSAAP